MVNEIEHRGPDDQGIHIDGNAGLGFVRLSIVDLSGGRQPMTNEDGSIWVTFNGEIYNHQEIRESLIKKGHVYKTKSDTETILHLYEEEGLDCFLKLNGMFAVSIWDSKKKKLIIARDRLGIKPLYYYHSGDELVYSSEIKSILLHPKIRREVNNQALSEFFHFRYVSGEDTLFKNVKSLLPGHLIEFSEDGFNLRKYWDLDFNKSFDSFDLDNLINDSVKLRLMADVPIGVLLLSLIHI